MKGLLELAEVREEGVEQDKAVVLSCPAFFINFCWFKPPLPEYVLTSSATQARNHALTILDLDSDSQGVPFATSLTVLPDDQAVVLYGGQDAFVCELCSFSTPDLDLFGDHQVAEHGGRPFRCELCLKLFVTRSHLLRHRRIHTGERPFECHFCPMNFNRKESLVLHLRTHTGERPFDCKYCPKTFTRRSKLMRHSRMHHAGRLPQY